MPSLIIDSVLGKHIRIEYLTLCNGCHIKIHESSKRELNVNNKHIQYYEILRQKKSLAKGKYIKEYLIPHLESLVDVKMFKLDKVNLKESFEKISSTKTLGINSINEILKSENLPYKVNTGIRKSYRDSNGKVNKEGSWWVISKNNS